MDVYTTAQKRLVYGEYVLSFESRAAAGDGAAIDDGCSSSSGSGSGSEQYMGVMSTVKIDGNLTMVTLAVI